MKPGDAFLCIGKVGRIHDKTAEKHESNQGEQVKSNHYYHLLSPPIINGQGSSLYFCYVICSQTCFVAVQRSSSVGDFIDAGFFVLIITPAIITTTATMPIVIKVGLSARNSKYIVKSLQRLFLPYGGLARYGARGAPGDKPVLNSVSRKPSDEANLSKHLLLNYFRNVFFCYKLLRIHGVGYVDSQTQQPLPP